MNVDNDIEKSFVGSKDGIFSFYIDKNFCAFKGHFPTYPILPGIVHIEIVLFCIRKMLAKPNINIKEIKKIKFIKPIPPATQVCVEIARTQNKINAVLKNENDVFSQIQLWTDDENLEDNK
ncbi:MAG: hypothetical protein LBB93_05920 [Elusimicrobiota bacterium]|jgi:3-hydroxymyristoyl/3-hydroxydecanoyl-(acyl carrier protein) dehydratase|nr:hypothetical protein [Elusimicrobiota bacterium]